MLNIPAAIAAKVTVEPSELALGESEAVPIKRELEIRNSGPNKVIHDITHEPALATGPNRFVQQGLQYRDAPATVTFKKTTVAVDARDDAEVKVTIAAPDSTLLEDRRFYGGYIVLAPQGGGAALRVPFAGFKGDYQSIQVLAPTANGFLWFAASARDTSRGVRRGVGRRVRETPR